MKTILQYLPGFVDGDPETTEFSTQEELLAIEWINRWTESPAFIRFVLRELGHPISTGQQWMLFAEITQEKFPRPEEPVQWGIGFLFDIDGLDIEVVKWQA